MQSLISLKLKIKCTKAPNLKPPWELSTLGIKSYFFFPTPGNSLQCKFSGPYIVAKKLSQLNYIVHTPDRRRDTQLVHINLMKPYLSREPEEDTSETVPVAFVCQGGKESVAVRPEEESGTKFDISSAPRASF